MNTILFAESMEIEFEQIYTEFTNAVAYANARLIEDGMAPSYIREAGDEKASGGLFGFIKRIFESISRMLTEAGKKMKSFLFGAKLDESKANEKITCDKNPDGVIKILNGEIPKYKEFLKQCLKGEVSVEEAKAFCEEKKGAFGAIGTVAISAGSLFGISKIADKSMSKWKADAEEAFEACSEEIRRLSEKAARTEGGMNDETVKQATTIVLNSMSEITGGGINAINKFIRELYVGNYVKARMEQNVEAMTTTKGRLKSKIDSAKRTVNATVEETKLGMLDSNIKKGVKSQEKIAEQDKKNRKRISKAKNKVFVNSDRYEDPDVDERRIPIGKRK